MKLLKDLLYNRDNAALDISRLSVFLSVLCFWAGVGWVAIDRGQFDPLAVGGGIAAVFAGGAGWIHMRQRHEDGGADAAK